MTLYIALAGFLSGVVLRSLFILPPIWLWTCVAVGVLLCASYFFFRSKKLLLLALFLVAAALGLVRVELAQPEPDTLLENQLGEQVTVEGLVVEEPDRRERSQRLIVRLEGDTKALVSTDLFPEVSYGDTLRIEGKLSKPENFITDTGREFDYINFLAKDDILYQISFAEIEITDRGGAHIIKRNLFVLKETFLERAERVIPEPQAALLGGLVVGAKQSLGQKLQDDFRTTGLIHIVVLSGYNVTIIAEALMKSLSFVPRFYGMGIGAFAIVLFAIMTGASATIVRASIMALLVILARATGRTYAITRALFIAGFLMVLHNPYILLHDPSFQLSFLATIGLIHVAPKLEKYFTWLPEWGGLRLVATATISTQLFVLPLLLYMTGEFSLVALPANLLVLAAIPATMLFGFLAGVVGFLSTTLSMPFGFVAYVLLSYELWIVEISSAFSFASITLPLVPIWLVLVVYVFAGGWLTYDSYRKN